MTARELYEYALIELNKLGAPSLLTEDYVYFINKAIQQYVNLTYNRYDTNQQSTDDLRVLKATALFTSDDIHKIKEAADLNTIADKLNSSILDTVYYIDLPKDYVHLLNCIVEFTRTENYNNKTNCSKEGTKSYYTAKRLTSDMFGGVINNFYQKPSYKRPYYYLNSINLNNSIVTNKDMDSPLLKYSEITIEDDDSVNTEYLNDKDLSDLNSDVGNRLANPSNVRLELRFGDDKFYKPTSIYIEYIKAPMYIRLTQEQIDNLLGDDSQIMEFPDYVCYEIINILTRLIMENASDPRLQTNSPINNTISSTTN